MTFAIHHIGLRVTGASSIARQWCEATGFTGVAEDGEHALLAAPNAYVELSGDARKPLYRPVNTPGITHICVQAHAMPALHGAFERAGAAFHSPPVALGTGNLYCYARDAEHNVIELEALPYAPSRQAPWLAHVALATPDAARLADFYAALLNTDADASDVRVVCGPLLGPSPVNDAILALQDAVMRPVWVVGANVSLEFWEFVHPPMPVRGAPDAAGYDHIAFEVRDLDAATSQALAAGAALDRRFSAWFSDAPAALLRDPDHNRFELIQVGGASHRVQDRPLPSLVRDVEALKSLANAEQHR